MTAFAWTAKQVAAALGLPALAWDHAYSGVGTDTRTLREGELFVALKGARFDAHDFLGDARAAGVGGVVVRRGTPRWPGFDWFEVDETLVALGQLARYRRDCFPGPVIAVTGTTGKTSTRELIAAALGPAYRVHKSERNLNNLVGVPLTLLAAPLEAEVMVVECGASVPGEVARLRGIVRPDVAVVTNAAAGHLEGFGTAAAVLQEKLALLSGVATAVVGTSPPALAEAARAAAARVVTAAVEPPADWTAERVVMREDGRPIITARGVEVALPLHGRHMADNALIALAVADALGVSLTDAARSLAGVHIPGGRSEIIEVAGMTIINDCYNANPSSLRAALALLTDVRGRRRAAVVVGTMLELGAESPRFHREAAKAVLAAGPDVVGAVGEFATAFAALGAATGSSVVVAGETPEDVAPLLREHLGPGDVVLLKASRGVALEKLIPLLWPSLAPAEVH
jgi:UDP-N-acetylmuramoyl-tripeptide--D-alanyl-D-alanine ligase